MSEEALQKRIDELESNNRDLRDAFESVARFQEAMDDLAYAKSEDEILPLAQKALDRTGSLKTCKIFLKTLDGFESLGDKDMLAAPQVCELASWCLDNEAMTFLPDDLVGGGDKSVAICPLVGRSSDIGAVCVSLEVEETEITEQIRITLNLFASTLSTVLENQRMRTAISDSMLKFSKVLESVPHSIFNVDLDGNITMLNQAAELLLQVDPIEVLDEPYGKVLPKHVTEIIKQLVNNVNRQSGEFELEVEHKIGEAEIMLAIAISPILNTDKQTTAYVILIRDITLSREVAKLRQLDHMKNEFISLVSHELRTPIAAIMTYTESLMMEGMIEDEEERQEFYQTIYSESERLTRLVNDILDLTKMESGKLEYIFGDTNVVEAAEQAVFQINPMAEKKGFKITLEPPATDIPIIRADRDRLLQVYTNVLSNAVKFTEEGAITVRIEHLVEQGQLQISIQDTGQGIPPEYYSHIFNKFEQIEDMKHHSSGTGLGMPICKQIIEEGFGGEIWFESEVGVGTTFFFTLTA